MIKVLMCGNHPSNKGGMTSVIRQIREHDWNHEDIRMDFIPTYMPGNPAKKIIFFCGSCRKILQKIRRDKPDIVYMHMSCRGSFTRKFIIHKICKRYEIPDIIHLHGSEFQKWYEASDVKRKRQIRRLLKECTRVIVLGDKWNQIVRTIEPLTHTAVVHNTVEIPDNRVQWSREFKILFMGVLIPRKGVQDLLKAVRLLKDQDKLSHVKFIIAGTGSEETFLKSFSKKLGIDRYVAFAGWTDGEKKRELFRGSQMMVLPSYHEGLPVAILEGISYGMPIVATDVGDISTAVIEGENGYLVQPGDVSALAEAMYHIYSDRSRYVTMSTCSRTLAEQHFSDETFFEMLTDVYREAARKGDLNEKIR